MTDFEYFFSFFGLLLGLTVAEVLVKFADAIDAHHRRPIGWLTPLLAVFVLFDISGFWMSAWAARDLIVIRWPTFLVALCISIGYFLSASLVFPRSEGDWGSLDEHFWARHRWIAAGIGLVNLITLSMEMTRALPRWNDFWFFFYQVPYYGLLLGLWFVRTKRSAILVLLGLVAYYLMSFSDALPGSNWANKIGLNGSAAASASTSDASAPR